ncbi:PREDICTED: gibberellin-regulated protein 6 [Tarenaya hassleriana]|uniref:gibberellin-regulated protein 6 n=1 Tax=Tarenaya hassleriana TaxID=28532 RepID=UPI00053C864D|nr:PREDICTED: gibberellin-regulated protein 6 [Tarenaya hassleriana]
MAKLIACIIFLTCLCISVVITPIMAKEAEYHLDSYGPGSLKSSQCPSQCIRRCGKTQYHKPCMFFCQKCCAKCLCVPPGTFGNKQVCPCYNNWKTKRGGPKCP